MLLLVFKTIITAVQFVGDDGSTSSREMWIGLRENWEVEE